MSKHEKFIFTPITSVIDEMKTATSGMGDGIEVYPLWDYVLQAVFIKMTGFMEQKMKCIDWEMATNGYEYRREFLSSLKDKGEYSSYLAKNMVYNGLVNEIVRYSEKGKKDLLSEIKARRNIDPVLMVDNILTETKVIYGRQRDYYNFLRCNSEFSNQYFVIPSDNDSKSVKLFENKLLEHYKQLYNQRNRIAHNTLSYQENLPELTMLTQEPQYSRNYFFWFAILTLTDEIFMELYLEYSNCLKKHSYFFD